MPARLDGPVGAARTAANRATRSWSTCPIPVFIWLTGDEDTTRVRLSDDFRVDGSPGLLSELRVLFGPDAVRLIPEPVSGLLR